MTELPNQKQNHETKPNQEKKAQIKTKGKTGGTYQDSSFSVCVSRQERVQRLAFPSFTNLSQNQNKKSKKKSTSSTKNKKQKKNKYFGRV